MNGLMGLSGKGLGESRPTNLEGLVYCQALADARQYPHITPKACQTRQDAHDESALARQRRLCRGPACSLYRGSLAAPAHRCGCGEPIDAGVETCPDCEAFGTRTSGGGSKVRPPRGKDYRRGAAKKAEAPARAHMYGNRPLPTGARVLSTGRVARGLTHINPCPKCEGWKTAESAVCHRCKPPLAGARNPRCAAAQERSRVARMVRLEKAGRVLNGLKSHKQEESMARIARPAQPAVQEGLEHGLPLPDGAKVQKNGKVLKNGHAIVVCADGKHWHMASAKGCIGCGTAKKGGFRGKKATKPVERAFTGAAAPASSPSLDDLAKAATAAGIEVSLGMIDKEALAAEPRATLNDVQRAIWDECEALAEMLIAKNRAYGNSALDPVRIFSKAPPEEQIRVRLDDKLSRLMRGEDAGEDTEQDLLGYLVLLRVHRRAGR